LFDTILNAVSAELFRAITGKLFTDDQIRAVSSNAVGKYFVEWLPKIGGDKVAHERVEEARGHIASASAIITDMQAELSAQTGHLDKLLVEIEEKKKLAERYADLAATNQQQVSAFRQEMEEALRKELVAQSEKGKRLRQAVSVALWLVTLFLGAALGTYFKEVSAWVVAHTRFPH
jgi:hypothetical protein